MGDLLTNEQADTLGPLLEVVIPADEAWPSAADVIGENGVAARCANAFPMLDAVCLVLDNARELALLSGADSFGQLKASARVDLVGQVESAFPGAFKEFLDCVYELYYADPRVQLVVEQRTGFRIRAAVDGVSVAQFEDVLLKVANVFERGKRVRAVGETR